MDKYLFSYATASDPPLKRGVIRLVEKATGQPKLKRMYVDNQMFPWPNENFFQAAVRKLALDVRYDANALTAIPADGSGRRGRQPPLRRARRDRHFLADQQGPDGLRRPHQRGADARAGD